MISDWTEVAETFDSMGLHENLLRGIYAYGEQRTVELLDCCVIGKKIGVCEGRLCSCTFVARRFREAVCDPAEGNCSVLPRLRRDSAGSVRDWQDRHLLRWYPPPGVKIKHGRAADARLALTTSFHQSRSWITPSWRPRRLCSVPRASWRSRSRRYGAGCRNLLRRFPPERFR